MSEAAAPEREGGLLGAEDVYALASLELRARAVADGVLAGTHRSRRFGSSSEFAEHKAYTPGDDLRRLDWKAYARIDRYFVRRYEEETSLDVAIVVDCSGSMAYAGGARGVVHASKLQAAATLAAAIAYVAQAHSDSVALSLFAGTEQAYLPPRARRDHLAALLTRLEEAKAGGPTNVLATLERVAERLPRRSLLVLLTDFLDTGPEALAPLGVLRRRGSDAIALHVLDRDELELPFDGVVRFEDLEGDREVQVDVPLVRAAYREELGAFLRGLEAEAVRRDVRYHLVPTDAPPAPALKTALSGTRISGAR